MVVKEDVIAKAKELSITLTDAEVEDFVKQNKLPEKPADKRQELREQGMEKLVDRVLSQQSEIMEKKHDLRTLKEDAEKLTKEIQANSEMKNKYPELEKRIQAMQDSEKKRRELVIGKLDDKKKAAVSYLLEVDKVSADQFDQTIEIISETKSPGSDTPPPGSPSKIILTEAEKAEAARMNLTEEDYVKVMKKRKEKQKGS
jgi:hypothetical protein